MEVVNSDTVQRPEKTTVEILHSGSDGRRVLMSDEVSSPIQLGVNSHDVAMETSVSGYGMNKKRGGRRQKRLKSMKRSGVMSETGMIASQSVDTGSLGTGQSQDMFKFSRALKETSQKRLVDKKPEDSDSQMGSFSKALVHLANLTTFKQILSGMKTSDDMSAELMSSKNIESALSGIDRKPVSRYDLLDNFSPQGSQRAADKSSASETSSICSDHTEGQPAEDPIRERFPSDTQMSGRESLEIKSVRVSGGLPQHMTHTSATTVSDSRPDVQRRSPGTSNIPVDRTTSSREARSLGSKDDRADVTALKIPTLPSPQSTIGHTRFDQNLKKESSQSISTTQKKINNFDNSMQERSNFRHHANSYHRAEPSSHSMASPTPQSNLQNQALTPINIHRGFHGNSKESADRGFHGNNTRSAMEQLPNDQYSQQSRRSSFASSQGTSLHALLSTNLSDRNTGKPTRKLSAKLPGSPGVLPSMARKSADEDSKKLTTDLHWHEFKRLLEEKRQSEANMSPGPENLSSPRSAAASPNLESPTLLKAQTPASVFQCSSCNVSFQHPQALHMHSIQQHVKKSLECPDCGRKYRLYCGLKRHQLTNCPRRPLKGPPSPHIGPSYQEPETVYGPQKPRHNCHNDDNSECQVCARNINIIHGASTNQKNPTPSADLSQGHFTSMATPQAGQAVTVNKPTPETTQTDIKQPGSEQSKASGQLHALLNKITPEREGLVPGVVSPNRSYDLTGHQLCQQRSENQPVHPTAALREDDPDRTLHDFVTVVLDANEVLEGQKVKRPLSQEETNNSATDKQDRTGEAEEATNKHTGSKQEYCIGGAVHSVGVSDPRVSILAKKVGSGEHSAENDPKALPGPCRDNMDRQPPVTNAVKITDNPADCHSGQDQPADRSTTPASQGGDLNKGREGEKPPSAAGEGSPDSNSKVEMEERYIETTLEQFVATVVSKALTGRLPELNSSLKELSDERRRLKRSRSGKTELGGSSSDSHAGIQTDCETSRLGRVCEKDSRRGVNSDEVLPKKARLRTSSEAGEAGKKGDKRMSLGERKSRVFLRIMKKTDMAVLHML
ncbi:uncharacterized protein [Ptychodera flava]|uniref:uncharacterized protein n=1 Tax=Ptychodera flava TaxID=63121 RepID=UPI00396A0DB9